MDITWSHTITINAPIAQVYTYLADFPRHTEWAQSVQQLVVKRPGNANGVGTIYTTAERQGWQADRRPYEPLTQGIPGDTLCQVMALEPHHSIIWRSWVPYPGVTHAGDFSFQLEAAVDGTRLTQNIHLYDNWIGDLINRHVFKTTEPKAYAQWEASLRNIKTILEGEIQQNAQAAIQKGRAYAV
jgi:Polyketide cyclase / dehydrase and lipid transport